MKDKEEKPKAKEDEVVQTSTGNPDADRPKKPKERD